MENRKAKQIESKNFFPLNHPIWGDKNNNDKAKIAFVIMGKMDKAEILEKLQQFVSIKSVSANKSYSKEMDKAVSFLKKELSVIGFEVEILKLENHPPFIFVKYIHSQKSKTIAIYGHCDVQPEDPIEEWESDPFKLSIRNGKIYGRGVADNKGHIIQNIFAIKNLIKFGKLNKNIIFLIEGEEECGSAGFEKYLNLVQKDLESVDEFYITDVDAYDKNVPQVIYALRGLCYFEIELQTGKSDLHSGVYGNAVLNSAQVLSDLFSKMKNFKTGRITIPHFYDDVKNHDGKEIKMLQKNDRSDSDFAKEAGVKKSAHIEDLSSYLSAKLFPSMDIHGIESGYIGEGPKTVIPNKAKAKFSFRLVENQKVKNIKKIVEGFISENIPKGVDFKLKTSSCDDPFYISYDNKLIKKVAQVLSDYFENKTVIMREGGSIPAAAIFQRNFKKPIILTGFILPDSNLHAPNENFDENMFFKGIGALEKIYNI